MDTIRRSKRSLCFFGILLMSLLIVLAPYPALADETEAATTTPIRTDMSDARQLIRNYAYFQLNEEVIKNAQDVPSLIQELQKVDPWAQYYPAETYQAMIQMHEGDFIGIGVYLGHDENGQVIVQGTIPGSAAAIMGLEYGDIIVEVDGVNTRNYNLQQLLEVLSGEAGDLLKIKYERNGVVDENTISRNVLEEPTVQSWLLEGTEGIGYLLIEQFTTHTGKQVREHLEALEKKGMQALVLDLRNCPGGVVDSAVEVSGTFAGDGPMLFYVYHFGWYDFIAVNEMPRFAKPFAVLINGDTASAAEIVAANIQDVGAAPLIGVTSFGKGLVQALPELPSGAGFSFTMAKYISHGYQDVHENGGVLPDIYVEGGEAQLAAAVTALQKRLPESSYVKFYVGKNGYARGTAWREAAAGAFIQSGSAYVPAVLALEQLGWQVTTREGIHYATRDGRRLILNPQTQQILTGGEPLSLVVQESTSYLPVAMLRDFGHVVEWNAAERSVQISR